MKGVNHRVFLRSFFLETLWNYEKMQNVGFVFCMYPALFRLFRDSEERNAAVIRNLDTVNTHPSMGPLLAGLTARLEHDLDPATVISYRKRIMSVLAAHGDHLFWGLIKPLAGVFGVILTLFFFGTVAGSLAALVIYNTPNMLVRSQGFQIGWGQGLNCLQMLNSSALDNVITWVRMTLSTALGVAAGLLVFAAMNVRQCATINLPRFIVAASVIMLGGTGFLLLRKQVPLGAVIHLVVLASVIVFILIDMGILFP
ncbi:MAG: PTS system mannose/fructose/sorbose family transporter subunit IID [Desulfomonile sp.]